MKCTLCIICSWIVGLSGISLGLVGIFQIDLPTNIPALTLYSLLILIALGFLYYQIIPCQRCEAIRLRIR